jgi:vesicle transport through interaction with t-SNAREs protein 1
MNTGLQKDKERWDSMHQKLAESEQYGIETLAELQKQKEQMYKIKDNLQQAENNIDTSNRILKTMSNRQFWMKVISLELA